MTPFTERFTSLDTLTLPGVVNPAANWILEARDLTRATLVPGGGIKLTALPGDTEIAHSGAMVRCDLYQCHPGTADPVVYGNATSLWLAHEFLLTDDYVLPNGESTNVFDLHNTGQSLSASMSIGFGNWNQPEWTWGRLQLQRLWGTNPMKPFSLSHILGPPKRNELYRFLYQMRLSDKSDGYFRAWLNDELVVMDGGPTLFPKQGVFVKLANYRSQTTPAAPSSVVHKGIRIGATRASVER